MVSTAIFLLLTFFVLIPDISSGEDKEVAYLSLGDYTGPTASVVSFVDMAIEDYAKFVNDKGGVNGVKIKFIGVDTRYDIARAVAAYKKYALTPRLLGMNSNNSNVARILEPMIKRNPMPVLVPAEGTFAVNIGYNFLPGQCYQNFFGAAVDWIVNDWKTKGKNGMPTVGAISWDSPAARDYLRGGLEYAKKIGINLLEPESLPPGTLDHTTYLTRLKSADYIYITGLVEPGQTNIIRDAHRLGITTKTQFICDFLGPIMGLGLKTHAQALQGALIQTISLAGTDFFAHPLVKEIWTKYRKKPVNEAVRPYGLGLAIALNYEAALKIALRDVGYDKINGETMYRAYQKLEGKETTQGLQGPCAYSLNSRLGSREIRWNQVKGEAIVPVSGWIKAPDAVSMYKW